MIASLRITAPLAVRVYEANLESLPVSFSLKNRRQRTRANCQAIKLLSKAIKYSHIFEHRIRMILLKINIEFVWIN